MIVGAAAKGKTTLLHQIMSEKPVQSPKGGFGERNMATLGVSVKQWSYQYKPGGHGSTVSYHIGCWDFAGQEEFYSTHQCFLSQRSLYVVRMRYIVTHLLHYSSGLIFGGLVHACTHC